MSPRVISFEPANTHQPKENAMRVFITGASGHIGSALIPELLGAGHNVVGLARSDAAAAAVEALDAEVHRGSLDDLDSLRAAVTASDGVIHLAFKHEEMRGGDLDGPLDADLLAIEAMGEALAGTGKPFVGTSGTMTLAFGGVQGVGTEADVLPAGPRIDAENAVLALAGRGVRSSVVRLPPLVHSSLDHTGYTPALISFAREKGKAGYPGEGSNRWCAGHTLDAARLYRLALEAAPSGSRLHAVGDEGVSFREIAEVIGSNLGVPVASIPPDEVVDYFDFLAFFVLLDNPASSALTQELLDWHPTHPGLVDDLNEGHYFKV
jgi:nucleoside-diphosphate-sugar epimerase